jgi:hypothetical protein
MKLGTGDQYLTPLVIAPNPAPKAPTTPLTGIGHIVWASPFLAQALGGSGLGNIAGTAKVFPIKAPKNSALAKVQHGVELFDSSGVSLSDLIKGLTDDAMKSKSLSLTGGSLFKSTLAGAEIVLEVANPSEKSALEKMLSISLHGIEVIEPLADLVPHLAHAKPYLMAIVNVGGQLQAAIQNHPKTINPANPNYPAKPKSDSPI